MHANFKNVQGIKKCVSKYMIFQNYFRENSSKCSQTVLTGQASSSSPRHQPSYCGPWGCSGVRPSRHTGRLYLSFLSHSCPTCRDFGCHTSQCLSLSYPKCCLLLIVLSDLTSSRYTARCSQPLPLEWVFLTLSLPKERWRLHSGGK